MATYAATVNTLRNAFAAGKLRTVEARRHQLKRLIDMLEENKEAWFAAMHKVCEQGSLVCRNAQGI